MRYEEQKNNRTDLAGLSACGCADIRSVMFGIMWVEICERIHYS